MNEYQKMATIGESESGGEVHEVIDEALNDLKEQDRSVVLYRFFEGRDFDEIGGMLGKSAAAAQKQTRRAVEKLGEILKRRGVVVPAVGLASVLGAEFSQAAPPAVKLAILEAGRKAGEITIGASLFSKQSLVTAAVVAIVMSIPIANRAAKLSHRDGSSVETADTQAGSEQNVKRLSALPAGQKGRGRASSMRVGSGLDPEEITGEMLVTSWIRANGVVSSVFSPGPIFGEVNDAMRGIDVEHLWRILSEIDAAELGESATRANREQMISQRLAWRDPQRAIEYAIEHNLRTQVLETCMSAWYSKDPQAARKWFDRRSAEPGLERTRLGGDAPVDALLKGIVHREAQDDLLGAIALVESFGETEMFSPALEALAPQLRAVEDHETFLRLAETLPKNQRLDAVSEYSGAMMSMCLRRKEAVGATLQSLFGLSDFPQAERHEILLQAASSIPDRRGDLPMAMLYLATDEPQRVSQLRLLSDEFAEGRPDHFEGGNKHRSPEIAEAITGAYTLLIESYAAAGDERAVRYLSKITDPELRDRLAALIPTTESIGENG